jgi:chromosomal replication initiation ATPase DnaA
MKPNLTDVIQQLTACYFNITAERLRSKRRAHAFSHPRQIAMTLMRDAGFTYVKIAAVFGKHHTTVMHAVQSVRKDGKMKAQRDEIGVLVKRFRIQR